MRLNLFQLEDLAKKLGYQDYRSMLYDLYVVQGMGMAPIGKRIGITWRRVEKHLKRFNMEKRGRGGANNVRIRMTKELYNEVIRDGVPAVAERLNYPAPLLREQMQKAKF